MFVVVLVLPEDGQVHPVPAIQVPHVAKQAFFCSAKGSVCFFVPRTDAAEYVSELLAGILLLIPGFEAAELLEPISGVYSEDAAGDVDAAVSIEGAGDGEASGEAETLADVLFSGKITGASFLPNEHAPIAAARSPVVIATAVFLNLSEVIFLSLLVFNLMAQ